MSSEFGADGKVETLDVLVALFLVVPWWEVFGEVVGAIVFAGSPL